MWELPGQKVVEWQKERTGGEMNKIDLGYGKVEVNLLDKYLELQSRTTGGQTMSKGILPRLCGGYLTESDETWNRAIEACQTALDKAIEKAADEKELFKIVKSYFAILTKDNADDIAIRIMQDTSAHIKRALGKG